MKDISTGKAIIIMAIGIIAGLAIYFLIEESPLGIAVLALLLLIIVTKTSWKLLLKIFK